MMATQKRAKRNSSGQPAIQTNAEQNAAPTVPAVGPTISVTARPLRDPATGTRLPASPAAERAAMVRRRKLIAAGVILLALLVAFLVYRSLTSEVPTTATPAVAPTVAAAQPVAAAPIVAPAIAPTVAADAAPIAADAARIAPPTAAAAAAPIAAPAVLPTAAAVAATPAVPTAAPAAAITCPTIAGLPLFAGATCTEQKSDQDDGVTKLENTYTAGATADEIRRFYESAFASNGWTLSKFAYDISSGQRRASIDVDTDQGPSGVITTIRLTEYVAAAPAGTTCAPIAGLPAFPNATCVKFDIDQDDGLFKAKHSYSTSASPEEVRHFYETALSQNGWTGPDFQYELQQGLRHVKVEVETKQGTQGSFTEFRIAEK
jgi:hypothetical protein